MQSGESRALAASMVETLSNALRSWAAGTLVKGYLCLVRKFLVAWAKYVMKVSMRGRVACFAEVWRHAAEGKPVDSESEIFEMISKSIDYYLSRPREDQDNAGFLEKLVLYHTYAGSTAHMASAEQRQKFLRLLSKYQIVAIVRRYRQIQFLLNTRATEILASLQKTSLYKETESAPLWRKKVDAGALPKPLNEKSDLRAIDKYFKRKIKEEKQKIGCQLRKTGFLAFRSWRVRRAVWNIASLAWLLSHSHSLFLFRNSL
jgi:hypothetical protein